MKTFYSGMLTFIKIIVPSGMEASEFQKWAKGSEFMTTAFTAWKWPRYGMSFYHANASSLRQPISLPGQNGRLLADDILRHIFANYFFCILITIQL